MIKKRVYAFFVFALLPTIKGMELPLQQKALVVPPSMELPRSLRAIIKYTPTAPLAALKIKEYLLRSVFHPVPLLELWYQDQNFVGTVIHALQKRFKISDLVAVLLLKDKVAKQWYRARPPKTYLEKLPREVKDILLPYVAGMHDISGAIIEAIEQRDVYWVAELLAAGAKVNDRSENGLLPLLVAACKERNRITKLLLDAGADPNVKGKYGETPLLWAATRGYRKITKFLINAGANVNYKHNNFVDTPLASAIRGGHIPIAMQLIDADADVNTKNFDGCTPLMRAASCGHKELVKKLIRAGADLQGCNGYGETALDLAREQGCRPVVELLEELNKKTAAQKAQQLF